MSRTVFRLAAAVPLSLALVACGGGPKHIDDITPVVQGRLSGVWLLNAEESDDPQEAMTAARPQEGAQGRRVGGGMSPGSGRTGGRGGMPGAGGRPGPEGGRSREGGNGAPKPEAVQAMRRLVTVPPRHMRLQLSDSSVTVAYAPEDVWVLAFGDKVKRDMGDGVELQARADWEEGRLVVSRSMSGGGSVTETYMPSVDGKKLTVVVETSMGGRGGVEFRRVYDVAPNR